MTKVYAMSSDPFVNLHVHSDRSILDGLSTPHEIAQRAAELGQSALAISDHGTLSGCMSFKNACDAVGIKPILGVEAYVAPGSRSDTEMRCLDGKSTAYHLVLLAKNRTGWNNIVRLTTMANYGDAFYKKPRIDFDLLSEYSEGLICLSGCLGSELAQTALLSGHSDAYDVAERYRELFGKDYYVELQWHGQEDDEEYLDIATHLGMFPLVATADSHYTYEDEADTHDTLLCIQTLARKSDEKRFRFSGSGYYLADAGDMMTKSIIPDEAIRNTLLIAEQIETFDLTHKPQMLELPNAEARLVAAVQRGLAEKYNGSTQATLRAGRELDVINAHGFASYFLMVADIVRWSKSHGIAVGPGRGSVGGSLVAYVLGIHAIDPLVHHTMFERFMTMERVSPPDVDLDFSEREPVIQYIEATYGAANVVQIATFMKFGSKAALRDVARALEQDEFSPAVQETASALEGRVRGISRHAAGIIISPHPLEGRVPLMRPVGASKGASLQTAWDYDAVEAAGYEKVDILGVQRLATIQKAALAVGVDIDKACASLDDGDVYALLRRGETAGIFQLDSWAGTKTIKAVRPLVFEDIVAAIALDRPGPYESGAQDQYIARRRGTAYTSHVIPEVEEILKDTHEVLLYQEQAMALAQRVAGFTPGEADEMRHAIGKKDPEQMASLHEKFSTGCIYHDDGSGMSEAQAEELWSEIETHAGYSFNRSHAVAYAVVSYQCAWLKCHYPVAFMCALLNEKKDVQEKLRETCAEVRRMGIPFLGADVRYSGAEYSAEDNGIRIGLTGLVDFGQVAYDELQRVMHEGAPR